LLAPLGGPPVSCSLRASPERRVRTRHRRSLKMNNLIEKFSAPVVEDVKGDAGLTTVEP
jgi:hypothetical protein